jgi:hypothetical protein
MDQLFLLAQQINYTEPSKPLDEWSYDELMNTATYRYINDKLMIKVCQLVCNKFSPIKLIIKNNLRSYISTFATNVS